MVLKTIIILLIVIFISLIISNIESIKSISNYFRQKKKEVMSFKEAMDLTSLPIVVFENNGRKINFLLDTGASKSIINSSELSTCKYETIDGISVLTGIDGIPRETKYIRMSLLYNGKEYIDDFQNTDMSVPFDTVKKNTGVNVHGILGSKFFEKYKYVIDFEKLIAYSKK